MSYYKPFNYSIENAIKDAMRYDSVFVGDNYVMKDHGTHVQVNVDANNSKGHISLMCSMIAMAVLRELRSTVEKWC